MKKPIIILFFIFFAQGIVHNLGHPVTPDFVGGLYIDDAMFGVFFALMSLGLVIGAPIWGYLGDKGNRRFYILIGLLIYSLGQYIFGNVHNVYIMSLARFMSGLGVSGSLPLLMTYVIERSCTKNKTKNIGYSTAMMALGASVGYLVGGLLPGIIYPDIESISELLQLQRYVSSAELIFLFQAIINVGYAFMVYGLLGPDPINHALTNRPSIIQGFKDISKLSINLNIFFVSLTFVSIAAINASKFIEVYISDLGYGSSGIGNFVFVTGIVSIIATFILVPLVVKVRKDLLMMILINLFSAIIIFIVFRNNEIIVALYSLFMVYVVFKAIYSPLEQSFISSYAEPGKLGSIMGVRQSFFAIGLVIGPLIGGKLYSINPIIVFDFSVGMFLIAFVLLLVIRKNILKEKLDKKQI